MSDTNTNTPRPNPLAGLKALEVLAAIETWTDSIEREYTEEPRRLWAILTALRGPDNTDFGLKSQTTAVLRALTVPWLAQTANATVDFSGTPRTEYRRAKALLRHVEDLLDGPDGVSHFLSHMRQATEAIMMGLEDVGRDRDVDAGAVHDADPL